MKLLPFALLSILLLSCSDPNTTATEWDNPNDPLANNYTKSSSSHTNSSISEQSSSSSSSNTSSANTISSSEMSSSSYTGAILAPLATRMDTIIFEDQSLKVNRTTLLSISQSRGGGTLSLVDIISTNKADASISSGIITYKPNPDWTGKDSLLYIITDLQNKKDTGVIEITISPVNDKPILALDKGDLDTIEMDEEEPFATILSFVQTNSPGGGSDEETQVLQLNATTNKPTAFATQPALTSWGKLSFVLASNWYGDAKIYVRSKDNGGTANGGRDSSDLDSIILKVAGVNDAPVAVDDEFTALTDHHVEVTYAQLLANDHDIDNTIAELKVIGPKMFDNSIFYLVATNSPANNIFLTAREPNQKADFLIKDTIQDLGLLTARTNLTIHYDWTPSLCAAAGFTCGTVTDTRGTQRTYRWTQVTLVNQSKVNWFAENLNYHTGTNSLCPGEASTTSEIPEFCGILGRLYTHAAAMNACPDGWRLPTDTDWKNLEEAAGVPANELGLTGPRGSAALASEKLKSFAGWNEALYPNSYAYSRNLRNSLHLGISAAGIKYPTTNYYGLNDYGYFWSADAGPSNGSSITREFFYSTAANGLGTGIRRSEQDDTYFLSVRCMQDVP